MISNKFNKLLFTFFFVVFFNNTHAKENNLYRAAHNEICYEIKNFKIECGNFEVTSTILTKKHRVVSAGNDVMASFSAKTHPGDHPVLNRLAKKLGYVDLEPLLLTNKSILTWNTLASEAKSEITKKYSTIVSESEMRNRLSNYINSCLTYWAEPEARYDKGKQLPTLSEVSALCIANSGVLQ